FCFCKYTVLGDNIHFFLPYLPQFVQFFVCVSPDLLGGIGYFTPCFQALFPRIWAKVQTRAAIGSYIFSLFESFFVVKLEQGWKIFDRKVLPSEFYLGIINNHAQKVATFSFKIHFSYDELSRSLIRDLFDGSGLRCVCRYFGGDAVASSDSNYCVVYHAESLVSGSFAGK
ncbi:MAG: hypothetical protein Q4G69_08395, partial [Planctomycetia bacterium]|nr:hypothetical protein [Planctomycetia bacterium]